MTTHLSRLQRGLIVGAILGTAALPVPARAHNPTYQGTIQYGWGGTLGGLAGNTSVTMQTLAQSGCASTKFQGQEMNGVDAAVVPMADLVNHTVRLTWTHKGNTGNTGKAATWVSLLDASCVKKPIPKVPMNSQYLADLTFVVPGGMKWLAIQPEAGVTGVDWKIVAKHPAPPKPKPRRR